MKLKCSVLLSLFLALVANTANATLITHENVLEVRFEFARPFRGDNYNLLQFDIFGQYLGPRKHVMELYDGDTLLGSSFGPANSDTNFRAFGSPPHITNPAFADFSTIWDGSIDGLLRYTFMEGSGRNIINLEDIDASIWFITSYNTRGASIFVQPTVTSVRVVPSTEPSPAPLPASFYLVLAALLSLALVRRASSLAD